MPCAGKSLQHWTQLSRVESDIRTTYCFGEAVVRNNPSEVDHPLCCLRIHLVWSPQTRLCRISTSTTRDPLCCVYLETGGKRRATNSPRQSSSGDSQHNLTRGLTVRRGLVC